MRISETRTFTGIEILAEQEKFLLPFSEIKKHIKNMHCIGIDAINDEGDKIGFALLRRHNQRGYFLLVIMIDAQYQNKGYGTEFLTEIAYYMRDMYSVETITTTYDCNNHASKKLFESFGFSETDVVQTDEFCEVNMSFNTRWLCNQADF